MLTEKLHWPSWINFMHLPCSCLHYCFIHPFFLWTDVRCWPPRGLWNEMKEQLYNYMEHLSNVSSIVPSIFERPLLVVFFRMFTAFAHSLNSRLEKFPVAQRITLNGHRGLTNYNAIQFSKPALVDSALHIIVFQTLIGIGQLSYVHQENK